MFLRSSAEPALCRQVNWECGTESTAFAAGRMGMTLKFAGSPSKALLKSIRLYFHTIRHLKARQVAARLWPRFRREPIWQGSVAIRKPEMCWPGPLTRRASMLSESVFEFLNERLEIRNASDWNHPQKSLLWKYNLHYFDDLNADGSADRTEWHREIIHRWIDENPPFQGVGWQPYPCSQRIVNWTKWALRGNPLSGQAVESLTQQADFLSRNLEWHLLGNHLLANAKALVFAGLFLETPGSRGWFEEGLKLFSAQLREQILEDGGHFELSPMYHSLVLEDLLDVICLLSVYEHPPEEGLADMAGKMMAWLQVMRHPDGQIPFFNDAAFCVSPGLCRFLEFFKALGLHPPLNRTDACQFLEASGYVRVEHGPVVAFLDVAPVGPDHLPGHAHADTLSFELSLGGRRVFVNCGTSVYGSGPRRQWERSTAAHNTLSVDGENSSEVWGGFRVARRAGVSERKLAHSGDEVVVTACHDGFQRLKGKPVHRRCWHFTEDRLRILDELRGGGRHRVTARLHLHPGCRIASLEGSHAEVATQNGERLCSVDWTGPGRVSVERNDFAPEFGKLEPIDSLVFQTEPILLPVQLDAWVKWKQ